MAATMSAKMNDPAGQAGQPADIWQRAPSARFWAMWFRCQITVPNRTNYGACRVPLGCWACLTEEGCSQPQQVNRAQRRNSPAPPPAPAPRRHRAVRHQQRQGRLEGARRIVEHPHGRWDAGNPLFFCL